MSNYIKPVAAFGMLVLASVPASAQSTGSGSGCPGPGHNISTHATSSASSPSSAHNIDPTTDPSKPLLATAAFTDDSGSVFTFHFISDAQAQAQPGLSVGIGYSGGFYVSDVNILPGFPTGLKVTRIQNKWNGTYTIFWDPARGKMLRTMKYTGTATYTKTVNGQKTTGTMSIFVTLSPNALSLCINPAARINNMAQSMIKKINAAMPK